MKRGRPKSKNPKNYRLEIRLTEKEYNSLKQQAKKFNCSRAQLLLSGVECKMRYYGLLYLIKKMNASLYYKIKEAYCITDEEEVKYIDGV